MELEDLQRYLMKWMLIDVIYFEDHNSWFGVI